MSKWSSIANSRAEAQTIYFQRKEINKLKNKIELQKQEIKGLRKHLEQLKAGLQEANDNAEWWNNRYNAIKRQLDQLTNNWNELEEWIKDNLGNCRTNIKYEKGNEYIIKEDVYYKFLDKMKEIKERNK